MRCRRVSNLRIGGGDFGALAVSFIFNADQDVVRIRPSVHERFRRENAAPEVVAILNRNSCVTDRRFMLQGALYCPCDDGPQIAFEQIENAG